MNRLRAYREIEGINQEQLAAILGLSVPMVSAIEIGRRPYNGSLDVLGYRDDRLALPAMSEPIHRARASTAIAAKKRARELLRLAGEVFGELLSSTPKAPEVLLRRLPPTSDPDEIEELTGDLRATFGHEESGPIENLTTLVERAGVCIVPIQGLVGIDGLSAWVNDIPVIGVNPAVPGDRFRFTIGHECGHLTLHEQHHDLVESDANRFAGSLLIPRKDFDAIIVDKPKLHHFIAMKSVWGVSVAALIYRAHELGYVDDARYRALQIQMSKWRKKEPGEFQPARGILFKRLVEVNGGSAAVAKKLGVNLSHLDALMNWSHLRLA
ncbi:hypothetical protein MPNTM1_04553 [Mycolicibacterium parafortuitum]|uniref:XRE family transcriptional regulator n=1 Tax=Mycolicibacterium parafortuitum TaxID=39692 RepID=UPI0032C3F187